MKKIDILVLKAFIRPFIVTFFVVMFVLLMLFLFIRIDEMIGKGVDAAVILQLLWYASAANVPMALPLAILLSSIMTFGNLGENYELVAIKSAGISLIRAMRPLMAAVMFLGVTAFLFSDYMLPVANLKMGSLLYDLQQKKVAFLIDEGVFNNNLSGYSIRAKKKDRDGQTLHDVMIYEHNSTNEGNMNVLLANEGKMLRSSDQHYLVLKLKNGVRYEEAPNESSSGGFKFRQRLTRIRFEETEQKFDLSEFNLQRTDESLFKSNDIMLNTVQLRYYRDSVQHIVDSGVNSIYQGLLSYYNQNRPVQTVQSGAELLNGEILQAFPVRHRLRAIQYAADEVYSIKADLRVKMNFNNDYTLRVKGFIVQYHKKFTLSLACIALFFVGAPLGAIIRKGGLGMPVVVAVICFLVYHITSTIGEKSYRDGSVSPIIGMWIALIVLTPIGVFFTYQAANDSNIFELDFYRRLFRKYILGKKK